MRAFPACAVLVGLLQIPLAAPSLGDVVRVTINDLAYSPAEIRVRVGDIIEWMNGDFIDHTATAKSGDWDVTIVAGKLAQLQMTHVGKFAYFCRVHPGMTATIDVIGD